MAKFVHIKDLGPAVCAGPFIFLYYFYSNELSRTNRQLLRWRIWLVM